MDAINHLCLLAGCWLLTYLMHSTLLGLGTNVLIKLPGLRGNRAKSFLLKVALVGACLTATLQLSLGPRLPYQLDGLRVVEYPRAGETGTSITPVTAGLAPRGAAGQAGHPWSAGVTNGVNAVVALWGATALLLLARRHTLRRRFFNSLGPVREVEDPAIRRVLEDICRQARCSKKITLVSSKRLLSPMALGSARIYIPEIVLTGISEEQQKALLAHELAHLVRKDTHWIAMFDVLESVFFFQPLNRSLRKKLQEVTEQLCDAWAVRITNNGRALASCLVEVASWLSGRHSQVLLAGMTRQGSPLHQRVVLLLTEARGSGSGPGSLPLSLLAAGIILLTCLVAPGIAPLYAQQGKPQAGQNQGVSEAEKKQRAAESVRILRDNAIRPEVQVERLEVAGTAGQPSPRPDQSPKVEVETGVRDAGVQIDPPAPKPAPYIPPHYKTRVWE